jgi:hypothetical protein
MVNKLLQKTESYKEESGSDSERPDNTLEAELKKIHDFKMKCLDDKIEDPSDVE